MAVFFDELLKNSKYKNRAKFCKSQEISTGFMSELLNGKKILSLEKAIVFQKAFDLNERQFLDLLKAGRKDLVFKIKRT